MNIFLFLYPITEYVNACLELFGHPWPEKQVPVIRLNEMIDARYRNKDYRIYWLVFSTVDDPYTPDLSLVSGAFSLKEEDSRLACGISFTELCERQRYPNLRFVSRQLPRSIKRIVLGGFHRTDCVDKLAEFLHSKGYQVFVDEDTTERFFMQSLGDDEIPLIREEWSLESMGLSGTWLDLVRRQRRNKPWLVQT